MSFTIRGLFKRDATKTSAAAVPAGDRRRAQELVELGIAAENAGAAGQALKCYGQAIEADDGFAPAHMNLGIALQAAEDFAGAIASYQSAIALDPGYAAAHYNLGMARLGLGEYARAEEQFRAALYLRAEFPEACVGLADALEALGRDHDALAALGKAIVQREHYAGALFNASVLLRKMGRLDEAQARLREIDLVGLFSAQRYAEAEAIARRMTEIWPDHAPAWKVLGSVLAVGQRFEAALPVLRNALLLLPADAETHNSLGVALRALGRTFEAEASFRRAVVFRPEFHEAHNNLGNTLWELGRRSEAQASNRRALELKPDFADAHNDLGTALRRQGRLSEAQACYRRALQCRPGFPEAHNNLGAVLHDLARLPEAAASYRRALELKPEFHEAHSNLGAALQALGRLSEAEASVRRAIEVKPDSCGAHNNLGNILREFGHLLEAEAMYRRAIELNPEYPEAHNNLGNVLKDLGRLSEAEAGYRRALALNPDFAEAHSNLLFVSNYHPERSAEEIFSAYRAFDDRFGRSLRAEQPAHLNDRLPARRLRVGYVSPDFRRHACRHFIEPLLDHHDKSVVEVFAYAEVRAQDEVTARMKARVDHWVPTVGMSDAQLADRIRTDRIDILADLAGHTNGNRLLAFARKPAPVSVTNLQGFGYTTGLSAIDWCTADRLVVPEGSEHLFSEQPWRLSQCLVYRPAEDMGPVSPLPAIRRARVTFGTLTRAVRINHRTIRVWSAILRRVPNSRLRIDSSDVRDAGPCRILVEKFAAHDIARERLEMGFHSPPWDVLREIDIGLDCFPHNSATTLFESLYMGVPFVTLTGRPSVGRLGASILVNAGHPEWIAASEDEYVDKAVGLSADLQRLAATRARLRMELQASPLMDEAGYVRKVEAAYREMWRRWCAENAPASPEIER